MNKKIIDPEHLSIDQPDDNKSYYLYTGGVLKLVDCPLPEGWNAFITGNLRNSLSSHGYNQCYNYKVYVETIPSIEVSEPLKKIWKEGQRVEEGKDFCIQFWTGSSWWPIEHLVDKTAKPGTKLKAFPTAGEPLKPERVRDLNFIVRTEKGLLPCSFNIYKGKLPDDFSPYIPFIKALLEVESVQIMSAQIFEQIPSP